MEEDVMTEHRKHEEQDEIARLAVMLEQEHRAPKTIGVLSPSPEWVRLATLAYQLGARTR
jgi:hypothetical protein